MVLSTPSQRRMAGAGLSEVGVGPPPALATGYRNPFPALLFVVGPEQRTEVRCSLETRASGDGFSCIANPRGSFLNSTYRGRISPHLSQQVVVVLGPSPPLDLMRSWDEHSYFAETEAQRASDLP